MEIETLSKSSYKDIIFNLLEQESSSNSKKEEFKRVVKTMNKNESQQTTSQQSGYIIKDVNYQQQYAHIYFNRLLQIKRQLKEKLTQIQEPFLDEIIQTKLNKMCIIIGTVSKEMKLKPSILQKLNAPTISSNQAQTANYMSIDDQIYLEDNTGRVKLDLSSTVYKNIQGQVIPINNQFFVNGIVIAVQGTLQSSNQFVAKQIFFPSFPRQQSIDPSLTALFQNYNNLKINEQTTNIQTFQQYLDNPDPKDRFVAIISGSNISNSSVNYHFNNFKQFLFGNSVASTLKTFASKIQKLVIAGNFIQSSNKEEMEQALLGSFKVQETFNKVQNDIKSTMIVADSHLNEILKTMPVCYMPGDQEPSTTLLPQQPMHKCYFPKSSGYPSFICASNPYSFIESGVEILGTSGQNISDLKKYSNFSNNDIDLLELNLLWNHLAPSAPDTLKCMPVYKDDFFVIKNLPQVYFVGNCSKFQTKLLYENDKLNKTIKFTRLICVPEFSSTHTIALLNLRNLDTLQFILN